MIVGCNNVIVMLLMLVIVDYSRWISLQDVSEVLVGPLDVVPINASMHVFVLIN